MKLRGEIHLMAFACGEIVDDRHLMIAGGDQRIDGMRADKAGAAGDENLHRVIASLNRPPADRVVLELEGLDEVGLIQIASVENHWLFQHRSNALKVRMPKL